jgi:integrase/recombinase XerC
VISTKPKNELLVERARGPNATPLERAVISSTALQPRTKELYLEAVDAFLQYAGADPAKWNLGVAEDWLNQLLANRKPQTVGVYRKGLRYATKRWAAREDNDKLDFTARLESVKPLPAAKRVPLTDTEVDQIVAACTGPELEDIRDLAIIVLAIRTGLRREGMRALEFTDLAPPWISFIDKGGERKSFVADPEVFEALDPWLKTLQIAGVTTGHILRTIKRGVIGGRMSAFQIWDVVRKRAKAAGVRHTFPHLLRHTTVTWLRVDGADSWEVSQLTGQSEQTIRKIYTHPPQGGPVGARIRPLLRKP